ncbi:MAG: hypothetical protein U9R27_07370 [Campylobacterota bacterium]|nr:hypothetical protein [Campylobacterota bacterium]
MDIEKSTIDLKRSFVLNLFQKTGKKESIRNILIKLRSRKEMLIQKSEKSINENELADLKEELSIIVLHIKKGEDILGELGA